MDIKIKFVDLKYMDKLKKKSFNKNLSKDFKLYLDNAYARETTYVALSNKDEIVGMFAYEESKLFKFNDIYDYFSIDDEKYINKISTNKVYLTMIEVKEKYKNQGISKKMVDFAFQIFKEKNSIIQLTNIVMKGEYLINSYCESAKKYKIDLFFSHSNPNLKDKNIIFNYEKEIKPKETILNKFFNKFK